MTSAPKRALIGRTLTGAASLVLACGLLFLAVPHTIAAIVGLPGNSVIYRVQKGQPVSESELELVIKSRQDALAWAASPRDFTDLGLAQLLLAEMRGHGTGYEPTLLEAAVENLKVGLAKAPARPYVWTRLAYATLTSEGASSGVARSLEMALVTAPHEPRLLLPRLELCLLAWEFLSPAAQAAVLSQIRDAWARSPARVVELARHAAQPNVVRRALISTLGELKAFNTLYREGS